MWKFYKSCRNICIYNKRFILVLQAFDRNKHSKTLNIWINFSSIINMLFTMQCKSMFFYYWSRLQAHVKSLNTVYLWYWIPVNVHIRAEEDAEIARRLEEDLVGEETALKRQRELHDEVRISHQSINHQFHSITWIFKGNEEKNSFCIFYRVLIWVEGSCN